ncbi:hypothetical protein PR202_ga21166 [Eleusine coracana subsp. coracana]|uniref:non-specific serine/threonine protein kinase n=1 Tax=Eleusine coracana subsp. coracana TaxID=191504 RepID=A0AAV5D089_ELECO|nr:hypothetical protein PR202_ga21166 [Eleusine coracana subsp. coracana]
MPSTPWKSMLCCVAGGAVAGDDDTPSPTRRSRRSRRDRERLLPSSSSSSRVSLSSLGSSGTLTPEDLSVTLSGSNLYAFTYAELRAVTGGFSRANYLGCGGFGPVYQGRVDAGLRPGLDAQPVAVKYLDLDCGTQGHREWLAEVFFLGQLRHENLVKLVGYCYEDEHRMLVYEYMSNKSLEKHLFKSLDGAMPWMTRMKIAVGAAKGLAFLHDADTPVIYRDFKASNILLDSVSDTCPSSRMIATVPKVLGCLALMKSAHDKIPSDKKKNLHLSDPVPHRYLSTSLTARPYLKKSDKLYKIMDPAMECQYSSQGAERAAMVAYKCLSQNAKSRPTMREVVKALEPILDMHDYLEVGPFVFTLIVEDNNEHNQSKGKMVDGEKVDLAHLGSVGLELVAGSSKALSGRPTSRGDTKYCTQNPKLFEETAPPELSRSTMAERVVVGSAMPTNAASAHPRAYCGRQASGRTLRAEVVSATRSSAIWGCWRRRGEGPRGCEAHQSREQNTGELCRQAEGVRIPLYGTAGRLWWSNVKACCVGSFH